RSPRPKGRQRRRQEKGPPGTLRLLASLPMPAFVQDRYLNVLAANPMAQALSPGMRPGVNRLLAAFRRLWARQDVISPAGGPARMHHPEVGDLELYREKLIVAGTDGQVLVIYHADPGTPSAQALDLLGLTKSLV
ncbi:MAG: hypothetical protein ACRDP7_47500, partial [Trebonia sp.]